MDLEGKVAIVTGGSRGIGRGIAIELAKNGAQVVINYLSNEEEAIDTLSSIGQKQGVTIQADVSQASDCKKLVSETMSHYGKVDILVNNAGICPFSSFFDITEEIWNETIQTNLSSAFFVSQAAAKEMLSAHSGSIINIASVAAYIGSEQQVHYCASKGGMLTLTRLMANTLGPYGIRSNCLLVGGVPTDININQYTDEFVDWLTNKLPLRRMGTPTDIAEAVVFLASDKSSWITGASIAVDGGRLVSP